LQPGGETMFGTSTFFGGATYLDQPVVVHRYETPVERLVVATRKDTCQDVVKIHYAR
jgi:hypothetical protein